MGCQHLPQSLSLHLAMTQRGIQAAMPAAVDRLDALPTPRQLAARGERWGPYRTYASLYLWRIADAAVDAAKPAPRSQS